MSGESHQGLEELLIIFVQWHIPASLQIESGSLLLLNSRVDAGFRHFFLVVLVQDSYEHPPFAAFLEAQGDLWVSIGGQRALKLLLLLQLLGFYCLPRLLYICQILYENWCKSKGWIKSDHGMTQRSTPTYIEVFNVNIYRCCCSSFGCSR